MYSDPAKIRKHVIKVSLSDDEDRLINAYVNYTGEQKAAIVRELVLDRLEAITQEIPRILEGTH